MRGADAVAIFGGAPVLPHNGAVHRLAAGSIPHYRGFALVGDAQGGDLIGGNARLRQRFGQHRHLRAPNFFRIMLHQPRLGKMLGKGFLRLGNDLACMVENHRTRRSGALVER